ncbi:MAG: type II secretion system protein GspJ [Limisphaerales bacterium]
MKINSPNQLLIAVCRLPIEPEYGSSLLVDRSIFQARFVQRALRRPIVNRQSSIVNGFTLIEMILAVGIAAIVLVAINAVLFSALHLREVTQAAVDEATPVDLALTILRRDLQCSVPPEPNGILTGDFKAGNVASLGTSLPVSAEMFTATGALHANEPWGDIQRVTYELKNAADRNATGMDLVRSITRNLLSTATPDIEDQTLLSGVASLRFSCFDGSQWLDTWDTTDTSTSDTNLPVAVRVQIQMAGNNKNALPIEILVPIDSQSRTNT